MLIERDNAPFDGQSFLFLQQQSAGNNVMKESEKEIWCDPKFV